MVSRPLPLALAGYAPTQAAHRELDAIVAKYGQQCWEAALDAAARVCVPVRSSHESDFGDSYNAAAFECERKIRSLK